MFRSPAVRLGRLAREMGDDATPSQTVVVTIAAASVVMPTGLMCSGRFVGRAEAPFSPNNVAVLDFAQKWHALRLEVRGDHLEVFWNRDATFPDAGRVRVWTKADSITHFDDLQAESL